MASKRHASPLESEVLKKKVEFIPDKRTSYLAWISTEGAVHEFPDRTLRSSGKSSSGNDKQKQKASR